MSERGRPVRGMILGKFLPPHRGHQLLCDFARHYVDELAIVVGTLPTEPIPGELRHAWMQELFPDCQVLHLDKVLPQFPEEAETPEIFWALWRESLRAILPWPVDYVFASEAYGIRLAAELGAQFLPVDTPRGLVPVSGTAIRENPMAHWEYLPGPVRPWFVRKVCLFGPESTGKSTLAKDLAQHFSTVHVPEYAQILISQRGGELQESDLMLFARGQLAAEAALARQANRLLICDTDLLTTTIWSETLYGRVDPWIAAQAEAQAYDLTLLCAPDVPWVDDVHRLRPDDRAAFFARCRAALEAQGRAYTVLSGDWGQRRRQAIAALGKLLQA